MWYPPKKAFYYQTYIGYYFRGSIQNSIVHISTLRYCFHSLMSISYELLTFSITDGLCKLPVPYFYETKTTSG